MLGHIIEIYCVWRCIFLLFMIGSFGAQWSWVLSSWLSVILYLSPALFTYRVANENAICARFLLHCYWKWAVLHGKISLVKVILMSRRCVSGKSYGTMTIPIWIWELYFWFSLYINWVTTREDLRCSFQLKSQEWSVWFVMCTTNHSSAKTSIVYSHYDTWDEITYLFPNFIGSTVDVWELGDE